MHDFRDFPVSWIGLLYSRFTSEIVEVQRSLPQAIAEAFQTGGKKYAGGEIMITFDNSILYTS